MSQSQFTSLLRQVLMFLSAYAIGAGYVTAEQYGILVEVVVGAVPLVCLVWAGFASSKTGIVGAASKIDSVSQIVMDPSSSIPANVPSDKVVSG